MPVLSDEQKKIKHLLNRVGFGETYPVYQRYLRQSLPETIRSVMQAARASKPFDVVAPPPDSKAWKAMSELERKQVYKDNRQQLRILNGAWAKRLRDQDVNLREKMTLFWHDHFACRNTNPRFVQQQNNILRTHALGNFADLLRAVAKDPAMLSFLNNQENKKAHPNENFARELLELFTLGTGHYTESDIKEAARAFTGWGFKPPGEFIFRKHQHDTGSKEFMKKKGNFEGDDILSIILENPQTARFITGKLYRYLVSQESVNEDHVQQLATRFYDSGYRIDSLVEAILHSDWFYDEQYRNNRIKSPIEWMTGLQKHLGVRYDTDALFFLQRLFGHTLFYPPNVSGWPAGRAWIDSSSLAYRLKLPETILDSKAALNIQVQADGDVTTPNAQGGMKQLIQSPDLKTYLAALNPAADASWIPDLSTYIVPPALANAQQKRIDSQISTAPSPAGKLQRACMLLTSLPEYQLC